MHWRDAIQLEMAKITTIKADVRSTLHNTKNFEPQIFAEARYQLQGWCRDLPESMCLHSLLDNDLLATEDRSRTLFAHLTYLSGLMLFPQYLARECITKNFSTADLSSVEAVRSLNAGFSAAEQSARMLSLLRPQQDIIVKRWFCTTMLLFTLSQQLLRSSPHIQNKTTFKPAWESLKCLQLCASKDHAAKVLYSRLQPHIAVIQAERLRISTLPRQLPVGDGHPFAIPSDDSALYHTAHALLDLVAQPFPIISGDGIYSVMDE
ncbi:hypothetical protein D6D21_09193 [Aureobasidium pullulans]|uniref:Transcription factor domain-containing protein n=1 Tax=Aureobasidium pullulans TaxID=5580 RepID=A0AB74IL44_AURPU|nr:hypothetical protein D6D21_09193 [Aureobasidium pullulans]